MLGVSPKPPRQWRASPVDASISLIVLTSRDTQNNAMPNPNPLLPPCLLPPHVHDRTPLLFQPTASGFLGIFYFQRAIAEHLLPLSSFLHAIAVVFRCRSCRFSQQSLFGPRISKNQEAST